MTLIATATDSGVVVNQHGCRKTLSYSDATGNDYNQVVITSRARLYATNEALGQLEEWRNMDRDVIAEINGTPDRIYDETTPNGAAGRTPLLQEQLQLLLPHQGHLLLLSVAQVHENQLQRRYWSREISYL